MVYRSYPQSCKCAETGKSLSTCTLFECTCVCDLNAGRCDYGCCCDPDCTSDQIKRFETLDSCRYDGARLDYIEYCYSSAELYGVNPKAPMGGSASTSGEGVSRALCVEKKNYVFKSDFYTNTDLRSSSIFAQSNGQKEYSYIDSSTISVSRASIHICYKQLISCISVNFILGKFIYHNTILRSKWYNLCISE
jgi:hypothetical protein